MYYYGINYFEIIKKEELYSDFKDFLKYSVIEADALGDYICERVYSGEIEGEFLTEAERDEFGAKLDIKSWYLINNMQLANFLEFENGGELLDSELYQSFWGSHFNEGAGAVKVFQKFFLKSKSNFKELLKKYNKKIACKRLKNYKKIC